MWKWLKVTPPEIGSQWAFRTKNPFESFGVTVTDVQRGWVKYDFPSGLTSSSLSIRSFRTFYREVTVTQ